MSGDSGSKEEEGFDEGHAFKYILVMMNDPSNCALLGPTKACTVALAVGLFGSCGSSAPLLCLTHVPQYMSCALCSKRDVYFCFELMTRPTMPRTETEPVDGKLGRKHISTVWTLR